MELLEHWRLRKRPFRQIGDARCIQPAPLLRADAAAYLGDRLPAAGPESGDLFACEAIKRAAPTTGGIRRKADHIAKLALEFGGGQEYSEATLAAVDAVVRDMNQHQTLAIT